MNTGLTSQEAANNFNTNLYMKMKEGKFELRKRKVEEMRRGEKQMVRGGITHKKGFLPLQN